MINNINNQQISILNNKIIILFSSYDDLGIFSITITRIFPIFYLCIYAFASY